LSNNIFVDGIDEEKDFKALLFEHLDELGRVLDSGKGFTGKVVDGILMFGQPILQNNAII